jgi:MFS family permease
VGVIIGRSSEYFDFFVFGIACVLVFPSLLFPYLSKLDGTLAAFAIFSLAFVARPVGTALSMAVQRRWGRATKLTLALLLLGVCTVGMTFCPAMRRRHEGRLGAGDPAHRPGPGAGRYLGRSAFAAGHVGAAEQARLVFDDRSAGAPLGFIIAAALFAYLYSSLTADEFMSYGWRYPSAWPLPSTWWRCLPACAWLWASPIALQERELEPISVTSLMANEGRNVMIGAFAALASFALFHLVTVFPLSWISMYSNQSVTEVLVVQIIGALLAGAAIMLSGWLADRVGRRNTLGTMACLIGIFSFLAPWLLGSGSTGNNVFILVGFVLLGLSYGQASGTVTSNFSSRYRYTGAALSTDMAWLIGAAFAPLVALGVSAKFGLVALGIYLLSGALCTLAALGINRAIEARDQ